MEIFFIKKKEYTEEGGSHFGVIKNTCPNTSQKPIESNGLSY